MAVILSIHLLFLYLKSDRLWEVHGGVEGLTCDSRNKTENQTGDYMLCRNLNVRPCIDRTVYCTFPPKPTHPAMMDIMINPDGSKYESQDPNSMEVFNSVQLYNHFELLVS